MLLGSKYCRNIPLSDKVDARLIKVNATLSNTVSFSCRSWQLTLLLKSWHGSKAKIHPWKANAWESDTLCILKTFSYLSPTTLTLKLTPIFSNAGQEQRLTRVWYDKDWLYRRVVILRQIYRVKKGTVGCRMKHNCEILAWFQIWYGCKAPFSFPPPYNFMLCLDIKGRVSQIDKRTEECELLTELLVLSLAWQFLNNLDEILGQTM